MARLPSHIGKYELVRRLGHGGMGTVYLARHPDLDRLDAIKLLRDPLFDDELLQRFLREARAAANLRHDNIITIYDVGQHDHQPFMAMEYVDGTSLADVIAARQPLTLSQKLSYIEQICSGLHYAHCQGIVHRDVKPANLMVDRRGIIRILDFGIARVEGSEMTQVGDLMGTLCYMSPEQLLGQPVDYRTDIFAVGAVAYELLAYQQAFKGSVDGEVPQRRAHEAIQPLAALCPGLPPELEQIVMRALAKDPDQRFADLEQARAAIREVRRTIDPDLRLEPPVATAATIVLPRDSSKRVRAVQSAPASPATRESELEPAPQPRRRIAIASVIAGVGAALVVAALWLGTGEDQFSSSVQPAQPPAVERTPTPPPVPPSDPPAPKETPVVNPAEAALQKQMARITTTYRSGDLDAALKQIALLEPTDDARVAALARTIAASAFQSMTEAARAAANRKARELAPNAFGGGEQSRRFADQALKRGDFVEAGTHAVAAASSYKLAERDALATASRPAPLPPVLPPAPAALPPTPAPSPSSTPAPSVPTTVPPAAAAANATGSVATPPPNTLVDRERPGILQALTRYQNAYQEKSVKELRAVYPSLPRETGQNLEKKTFKDCQAYDVTFGNTQLALDPVDSTYATVTVRTTYMCQPKTKQPAQQHSQREVFGLRKLGDGWLIESLATDARPR